MNSIIKGGGTMAVIFLLCAFFNATFSIQYWTQEGRAFCTIAMATAGFCAWLWDALR